MEITIELIRAILELPGLVGWQIELCENCLRAFDDVGYPSVDDEEEILDIVQARWSELLERRAV